MIKKITNYSLKTFSPLIAILEKRGIKNYGITATPTHPPSSS
jgi:hypothetical protein